jgi:hypothetical protein
MSKSNELTGKCLCGAVEIVIAGEHTDVDVCHCNMCRRWSSGPLMALDAGKDIEITGEKNITVYRSSEWAERAFCKKCGTNLYYRLVGSGEYSISAGFMNNADNFEMFRQIFIDEKPEFYEFTNDTSKMTGAEVFALYASDDDQQER